MTTERLIDRTKNKYSQNGEDGIIETIFQKIPVANRTCCEFGAWDGIHLSNCRKLVEEGWKAIMIEGDSQRYGDLVENYRKNPDVKCVNKFVGSDENSLKTILESYAVDSLDFLSIDIDGLDYEIFETLDIQPTVLCIEVNAGHAPSSRVRIPKEISADNVGQPLGLFFDLAVKKGYDLVCYNGNAFFLKAEIREKSGIPALNPEEAYSQLLDWLPEDARNYLYLVNLGVVYPYHKFMNPYLSRESLGLGRAKAFLLIIKWAVRSLLSKVLSVVRKTFV